MITVITIRILASISNVKESLKVLQLTIPTNKAQIKKQYLILAKKYHPDSANLNPNEEKKIETKKVNKQLQQKFVNINKAYQYLREYTQQQINQSKDRLSTSSTVPPNSTPNQQQQRRKKTVQQIQRQQTYEYFNRKYYQQVKNLNNNSDFVLDDNAVQKPRMPLYRLVPQLYVGFLLLAVLLGDWTYRVMNRKNMAEKMQEQKYRKQQQHGQQMDKERMKQLFKNMGYVNKIKKGNQNIQ